MAANDERMLRLAAYLKSNPTTTLEEATTNVPGYSPDKDHEALRKQFRRDLQDLKEHWGVTAEYDERKAVYTLQPGFLTREERIALIAASGLVRIDGLDIEPDVGGIGVAAANDDAPVGVRIHDHLLALRDAVADHNPVTFVFRDAPRRLEPWAIGCWDNNWYVTGRDTAADAPRRFRLDRIEPDSLHIDTTAHFEVPADFDASSAFDLDPNDWGTDPELHARVAVRRDRLSALLQSFHLDDTAAGRPDADDTVIVTMTVRHYESFRDRIFQLGTDVRVLEPPPLVDAVVDLLRAMASSGEPS